MTALVLLTERLLPGYLHTSSYDSELFNLLDLYSPISVFLFDKRLFLNPRNMPLQTNTKSLYTPVFFSSSEPPRGSNKSTTTANFKVPSDYLNSLSRTHIALAQIVQEEPSSRPGSPTEDADGSYPDLFTQERVSALRASVKEAWAKTDGNPADGKWTALTHLLRIGVTSGRAGHWAGTRADLKAPDVPDGGWINAATEIEWAEWEKSANVIDKVENWKMRLETHERLASQIIKGTWQS